MQQMQFKYIICLILKIKEKFNWWVVIKTKTRGMADDRNTQEDIKMFYLILILHQMMSYLVT